ncbi:MAG: biotin--[acetyl-CoA-carboxylase] ligase [bacterium]|nr:biotin--[acetyl-CoA-carboxylase] ligase [bacterium]MDT8366056.1 biotin--[acetyl-CoA-carboxylase] ligase [bacterium]
MEYHHFEVLDSTNDHLVKMAEEGAPEWTIVIADRQASGRGRRRRDWWSPEGNLHMSILLRPEVSPRQLLRLPLIASLSFLSAMGGSGASLTVKWPNDILLNGRKMAGILTESRSEGDKVLWVIVGFGVNMIRKGAEIPVGLRDRIAFVGDLEEDPEPGELAVRIARGMKAWVGGMKGEGWKNAMEEWTRHAIFNIPYIFRDGLREMEGISVRLDKSGGLVMKTADGEVTVYSGEINKV